MTFQQSVKLLGLVLSFFISSSVFAYENPTSYFQSLNNQNFSLQGEWQQGGIIRGKIVNQQIKKLKLGKKIISTNQDGYFIFGFGRDDKVTQNLSYLLNNQWQTQSLTIATRTYKVQRINGLPKSKVSFDPKELKRIRAEYKLARVARNTVSPLNHYMQQFVSPLEGSITGVYGSQRILNGKPRRPHYGLDIAAPTGTPVKAPADAIVNLVHDDMFFSGGTLIIDHGAGLTSTFLHLSKILVKKNQIIKKNDVIAEVGATGRVTGPHLDWRMNWYNNRLDPVFILPQEERQKLFNP